MRLGIIYLVRSQNFPKNYQFLPPETYAYKYYLFFQVVKLIWNIFCVISLKSYTKKEKPRIITMKSLLSAFFFFLTRKLRHNPYIIELFRLKFLM